MRRSLALASAVCLIAVTACDSYSDSSDGSPETVEELTEGGMVWLALIHRGFEGGDPETDQVLVFHDPETGTYDVVDWKTGRPPGNQAERRAASVQLAAYRLAWADLVGAGPDQVRAAFHYVRANETVRPVDLLDAEGLAALFTRLPEPD